MGEELSVALGAAARRRLEQVRAASARLEAFALTPDEPPPALTDPPDAAADAARDLVLRALAAAAANYPLLRRLREGDAGVDELARIAGLPRLAAAERLNDLVAVGLVARGERVVGLTEGGRALVEAVEAAARAAT